jgi:hypothetical protein
MARMSHITRAVLVFAAAGCCVVACRPDSAERSAASVDGASCHDHRRLFVHGATRISAILRIDLKVANDDWAELTRLLKAFAESHELSFHSGSESRPGVVETLYLSLCAPNQPNIDIAEQRWASDDYANAMPGRGIGIRFYGDVTEADWHPIAVELVKALDARWPNSVRFRDGGGYVIDPPEFLRELAVPAQR